MEYAPTVDRSAAFSFSPTATVWLKLAVLYLIVGIGLESRWERPRTSRCARSTPTSTCSGGRR